jgi:hypothetical protein
VIGTPDHRRGDRVSNRDRAALERCAARADDLVVLLHDNEKIAGAGRVAAAQILTQRTKQAGCGGPKAWQHL